MRNGGTSNFSSLCVDVESLLFFCLIEISTIWRYCEYCEVETGIPKVAVAFAFSTTQKTIAAGTPSTNEKKTKRIFFL